MKQRTYWLLSLIVVVLGVPSPESTMLAASKQPYDVTKQWEWGQDDWKSDGVSGKGWFSKTKQVIDTNRWYKKPFTQERLGKTDELREGVMAIVLGQIDIEVRDTFKLKSICSEDKITECFENESKEPVLFIHGYQRGTEKIKGGKDYWADFPWLLQEEGFVPFEYRWNTGTRFEDAAVELDSAIKKIHKKTGKRVHIIAHSFGGLLVRTLLQGLHLPSEDKGVHRAAMELRIASLVTIGTPHSGIFDRKTCRDGMAFPTGQDTYGNLDVFEWAGQLSCQQTGEKMVGREAAKFYGVEDIPGELIPKLADFSANPLPGVNILVLMGLTTKRIDPAVAITGIYNAIYKTYDTGSNIIDHGDGLITGRGQRFLPNNGTGVCS